MTYRKWSKISHLILDQPPNTNPQDATASVASKARDATVSQHPIAFLDGDVIHGGGLSPSGSRCHIYLCDTSTMGSRSNTFCQKEDENKSLVDVCRVPVEDYYWYNNEWAQNQLHNKTSIDKCIKEKDIDEYHVLTERIPNPLIEILYDGEGIIDEALGMFLNKYEYRKDCELRQSMCVECYHDCCNEYCQNCDISKNDTKNTFVGDSSINGKGLFAGEIINEDEYILEYIGLEAVGKPPDNSMKKYIMQMKKHYIDARQAGNKARYINHSKELTAVFKKRIIQGVERCGVFSIQVIQYGEEIICDYGYKLNKS